MVNYIELNLLSVLNPTKICDGARVLEASGRPTMLVIGRSSSERGRKRKEDEGKIKEEVLTTSSPTTYSAGLFNHCYKGNSLHRTFLRPSKIHISNKKSPPFSPRLAPW